MEYNLIGDVGMFGVALAQFNTGSTTMPVQRHAAIVFREKDKEKLNMLHLATHYDLRCEPLTNKYKCVPGSYFNDEDLQILAETASRMWDQNKEKGIPYGFVYNGASVFNGDLKFKDQEGAGLTCATFLLAFFSELGHDLINIDGWQSREDDEAWQKYILTQLSGALGEAKSKLMGASIGVAYRFRPEEVVGSYGGFEGDPLDFNDAVVMGENLILEYNNS
ncbi:hypothetical protein [Pseudomonas palleroniana]|uniref:hypothetical protein n=1 Tax=Pseudomonas palleroniana TaxID=191390 RepID=UPI0018E670D3|nr:hypothetical protein [Pseudomonas palleroniana]MBI6911689.1 hypothetical protein [Pseudomonas palleroniana]